MAKSSLIKVSPPASAFDAPLVAGVQNLTLPKRTVSGGLLGAFALSVTPPPNLQFLRKPIVAGFRSLSICGFEPRQNHAMNYSIIARGVH
jgi:hypothetical protein